MDKVQLAKEGDKVAFSELIEEKKFKLYKTAKAILKDEDDVCDALQDCLIRVYKNINSLQNNEYFDTWMTRILINKCYDIINKNKKARGNVVEMQEIEEVKHYDKYNEDSLIDKVLNLIDKDLRLVTIMYYYNDFSVKQIAENLEIPEGTVKSRLSRARDRIYEILKKEEGEVVG